ncbi:MAG: DUF559 domain-containing protein [Gammaproteobacteria bacterium]
MDGGRHAEQAEEDAQRTAWLEAQGFRVFGAARERPRSLRLSGGHRLAVTRRLTKNPCDD